MLPFALAAVPLLAQFGPQRLAPYVPSPAPVVERMLELADLKPGETVYDLGCGDGRVLITAARDFHAKGVGVEISPDIAREAQKQVDRLGLKNRVTIILGDLLKVDLRPADVVTLYLLTSSNELLKPALQQLRAGARVVSHDFAILGWKPVRVERVYVSRRYHTIYLYEMPPVVAR